MDEYGLISLSDDESSDQESFNFDTNQTKYVKKKTLFKKQSTQKKNTTKSNKKLQISNQKIFFFK